MFDHILVYPIINLLVAFYQGLTYLHVPYALGLSIIMLTVVIRFILWPFTAAQLNLSKKMQQLGPQLAKMKEKYKGDMKKQQEAQMALYKENNVNPLAGCLPSLFQIVILVFGLYPSLQHILTKHSTDLIKYINNAVYFPALHLHQVWSTDFFGLNLSKKPSELIGIVGPIVLILPLLTVILQFAQSKMMAPTTAKKSVQQLKTQNQADDFATTFQKQSVYLLPIMIGYFSWTFFVGLSLYWNTYTLFGIIQQYKMTGWGSLAELKDLFNRNKTK